jgi:Mrp family chromosome partitioning ATPase
MPTNRPTDDAKSLRAAQRAERLGRLRATALCTVVENPTPRGLPADEPEIIAGGQACLEEIVADMALPVAELPVIEPRPEKPVTAKESAAEAFAPPAAAKLDGVSQALSDAPTSGPASGVAATSARANTGEEIPKTVLWSHLAPHSSPAPSVAEAARAVAQALASASENNESLVAKSQPPMAQPSGQVFRLDAAEGLSPRPPFAMSAFTLAKNDSAEQKKIEKAEKTEPSAYPVGELYRQLRQNVLAQLSVGEAAVVWISPTGSEPLSDHLVELASALAEGCDGEILLVDANFQSAALTRRFQLSEKSGLTDVLAKKVAAHAAGHETAVARVRVLPKGGDAAGRASRRANEEEWKSLLAGLKERYRYVLIDAPGVEEPHCLPLAKAADAAFVTIALDHTPRETVQEALEHLHLHKARVAGCVVTEAPA